MMNVAFPTVPNARVSQVFGNHNPAMYGGDGKHKGIDFAIQVNTPVYACMDGTVTVALEVRTGYGRHVRILHPDGSLSIYGHLQRMDVRVGEKVTAGQQIGLSGGDPRDSDPFDGLTTGAHLHWEIRPAGKHGTDQYAVDPDLHCLQYLSARVEAAECTAALGLRVRSKPVDGTHLRTIMRRDTVTIAEKRNGWARIHALRPEWCSADWLVFSGQFEDVGITEPITPPVDLTDAEKLARLWSAHPELHG
jgi:murein DD-endopeptidase MepM/ murein hydrolase activator NlpD